jgi:hypothetical protein
MPGIVFNEQNLCDLEKPFAILMATHSPSTFERVILGSVTLSVANNVQVPVLIVPDKIPFHLSSEVLCLRDAVRQGFLSWAQPLFNAEVFLFLQIQKWFFTKQMITLFHAYNFPG